VVVALSDTRGAVAASALTFGSRDHPLEPSADPASPFRGALQAAVTVDAQAAAPFAVEMTIAGSGALRFLPIGKTTEVHLQAPWRHPSFAGAFLPESRSVTDAGFEARWRVSYLARAFPHVWQYDAATRDELRQQLEATGFGVDLVQTVDQYQQTWRATKYGLLFILLTFVVVLLWEVRHALGLHPLQYLMVGCALVVFYLLLLSLSEHLGFAWAYGLATAATVGLVSAYAARILASGVRGGGVMAGWLATLYGFLYVLLRLEDLALLLGSIAVFLMLAAVMYFTRRVDWYTMRTSPETGG
jgi:inner membrane protein